MVVEQLYAPPALFAVVTVFGCVINDLLVYVLHVLQKKCRLVSSKATLDKPKNYPLSTADR